MARTVGLLVCAIGIAENVFAAWPLQERIDALAANGGGTLTLTAGVYRTGALFFKPGVNLHLEKGATILGVDEAEGYPMRETRIEGETCLYYPALVNADGCDGFTISGEGTIDGHGANTWEEFWTKRAAARKNGGDFRNKDLMRPRVLYVSNSKNVDISGVTFKNSKFWTTHFYDCEDVIVHDCAILADVLKDANGKELKGPSTDAIDIDKCRRFTVRNVDISVNDDGVVVKGGKGAWADDYAKFPGNGPTTDVLVENCTFRYPTHSALTLGSECPAATNVTMRGCTMDGCGNMINLKMRTDTPQHYANILVENCRGKCTAFFHVQSWSQYHDGKGRSAAELKSYADGVTLRNNVIEASRINDMKRNDKVFEITNLTFENNVFQQISTGLPLKHDGYVVEKRGTGNGESAFAAATADKRGMGNFVVKAETRRAFLYADYEKSRWMNAPSYPFIRDPHFKFRALDVSRSPESLSEWIAATGANAVYLKRGRPDKRLLRECAALDIPAYGFLYGCDAAKWNRGRYDAFVAAHPTAKGTGPAKSWEKGTLCPSDPATADFFAQTIREIAEAPVAGVVVCLWDDYGLNCVCARCKANGLANNWGRQVAVAVKAWERAVSSLGKELIVRTWASGASHWLGDEWVHAPGYGGESGEPLSVWGEAMKSAGPGVRFQTKVYNSDCQPAPPFSALLPVAPRREIAEWQITGQTVGLQYLPASVVDQTARQMRRVAELVSPEGGVMLYAGTYKRDGYRALSDDLNSVNYHVWRQLSWNPNDDVEALWREWAVPRHGKDAEAVIAAMKATERASVAAFSPLGLGAPTESFFAGSVERRESLLRYTNRFFLPEGIAALAPTKENIARVVKEKNDALAALVGRDDPIAPQRFDWLRAQLVVTRALDGALWRYFYLRELAKDGRTDVYILSEIDADFDAVARHGAEVCPGLGRPFALMRDIRDKAHALVGHVPDVETKTDVAKCRVAIRTGGGK